MSSLFAWSHWRNSSLVAELITCCSKGHIVIFILFYRCLERDVIITTGDFGSTRCVRNSWFNDVPVGVHLEYHLPTTPFHLSLPLFRNRNRTKRAWSFPFSEAVRSQQGCCGGFVTISFDGSRSVRRQCRRKRPAWRSKDAPEVGGDLRTRNARVRQIVQEKWAVVEFEVVLKLLRLICGWLEYTSSYVVSKTFFRFSESGRLPLDCRRRANPHLVCKSEKSVCFLVPLNCELASFNKSLFYTHVNFLGVTVLSRRKNLTSSSSFSLFFFLLSSSSSFSSSTIISSLSLFQAHPDNFDIQDYYCSFCHNAAAIKTEQLTDCADLVPCILRALESFDAEDLGMNALGALAFLCENGLWF